MNDNQNYCNQARKEYKQILTNLAGGTLQQLKMMMDDKKFTEELIGEISDEMEG